MDVPLSILSLRAMENSIRDLAAAAAAEKQ